MGFALCHSFNGFELGWLRTAQTHLENCLRGMAWAGGFNRSVMELALDAMCVQHAETSIWSHPDGNFWVAARLSKLWSHCSHCSHVDFSNQPRSAGYHNHRRAVLVLPSLVRSMLCGGWGVVLRLDARTSKKVSLSWHRMKLHAVTGWDRYTQRTILEWWWSHFLIFSRHELFLMLSSRAVIWSVPGTISEVAELMAANLEKLNMQRQRRLETCLVTLIGSQVTSHTVVMVLPATSGNVQ